MNDIAIRELQRVADTLDADITQCRAVSEDLARRHDKVKGEISKYTSELQRIQESIQVLKAIDNFTK